MLTTTVLKAAASPSLKDRDRCLCVEFAAVLLGQSRPPGRPRGQDAKGLAMADGENDNGSMAIHGVPQGMLGNVRECLEFRCPLTYQKMKQSEAVCTPFLALMGVSIR